MDNIALLPPASALVVGQEALLAEADALRAAAERLDQSFERAVALILSQSGKVVVTGVGKSGHVAQKIASTLCSTGTPAVFLHSAEAAHGDLGIYASGDPTILISKSGTTGELLRVLPVLKELGSPLIGLLGNLNSPLGREVDVALDASVAREADPLNLAPTCSSTVALGLGDALAVALMQARQFTDLDFSRFHPAGQLGRNLSLKVGDVMHGSDACACVTPNESVRKVVVAMTLHPLGAACVVDEGNHLVGLITDGDIRRALEADEDIRMLPAEAVMTAGPICISPEAPLKLAVTMMEDRASQIAVLPVVGEDGVCLGLLRIHDIYQTNLA
jgi:arabinose-5-phosphate isomerase